MRRRVVPITLCAVPSNELPPPLHELEAEIMDELWTQGGGTVHLVRDALNGRSSKERAYTTVMTVMGRLHVKGLLDRERRGRSDVYVPRLSREEYLDARARTEVTALVEEFGDFALAHFASQMASLDAKRRQRLQRMARRG